LGLGEWSYRFSDQQMQEFSTNVTTRNRWYHAVAKYKETFNRRIIKNGS
jgi:hypothetical protein